jgi:hypothetical protein
MPQANPEMAPRNGPEAACLERVGQPARSQTLANPSCETVAMSGRISAPSRSEYAGFWLKVSEGLTPIVSIQAPVLHRLGQVFCRHLLLPVQIRDGTRHL